ncbi:uncharacterized protein EAF02_010201 [Botrytis sinoallii]|uniref:uncharacterized protein n=1 Tax=Botrytis sinoallii TaxID=1463999 RepID=UPI001900BBA0|nr:uncharacterized protein EAF02_010201 [Botrytis sinoallii]KAF7864233.1 hypothetical protein EAF02_010201 [Botrytis sinoallii]
MNRRRRYHPIFSVHAHRAPRAPADESLQKFQFWSNHSHKWGKLFGTLVAPRMNTFIPVNAFKSETGRRGARSRVQIGLQSLRRRYMTTAKTPNWQQLILDPIGPSCYRFIVVAGTLRLKSREEQKRRKRPDAPRNNEAAKPPETLLLHCSKRPL